MRTYHCQECGLELEETRNRRRAVQYGNNVYCNGACFRAYAKKHPELFGPRSSRLDIPWTEDAYIQSIVIPDYYQGGKFERQWRKEYVR